MASSGSELGRDAIGFGPPVDGPAREAALTGAVARHATIRIEAQRTGNPREPFVPIAEIRLEEEIQVDQEALHFDPVAGRGFVPHGFLTEVRKAVYPASVHSRPRTIADRARREQENFSSRLERYVSHREGESINAPVGLRWFRIAKLVALAVLAVLVIYLAVRFTRDRPVDYADDVEHFKHGSTGGERRTGIPYWLWIALPELFPEYLPDKTPGRGYSSVGMIYEKDADPRYALPVGMSMRNVRGIDLVYLNCAVCHTGTVRDAPGATPRVVRRHARQHVRPRRLGQISHLHSARSEIHAGPAARPDPRHAGRSASQRPQSPTCSIA